MKRVLLIIAAAFLLAPNAMAAHSGDGASTITTGWTNGYGSAYYIEWTWTGDGTTLSTTIDMGSVMPKKMSWYLFTICEVHGAGAADPSDHAITLTDSSGRAQIVTANYTASDCRYGVSDMSLNYIEWDGGNYTFSTTDIGAADTATVRITFVR